MLESCRWKEQTRRREGLTSSHVSGNKKGTRRREGLTSSYVNEKKKGLTSSHVYGKNKRHEEEAVVEVAVLARRIVTIVSKKEIDPH
jgi:hypothetical protein